MIDRISKLNELLQNQPEDSFLRHALALEYVKVQNDDKARQLFESILEKEPDYLGTYYHLGRLLERVGADEEAMIIYEKGLAVAQAVGDHHTKNELQMALDDLQD